LQTRAEWWLNEKVKSLSDSEKVLHSIDLDMMVIWNLSKLSLPSHLFEMNMTVILMVIDAQAMLAVRKLAFPALV
jgi:hypothetical protein